MKNKRRTPATAIQKRPYEKPVLIVINHDRATDGKTYINTIENTPARTPGYGVS